MNGRPFDKLRVSGLFRMALQQAKGGLSNHQSISDELLVAIDGYGCGTATGSVELQALLPDPLFQLADADLGGVCPGGLGNRAGLRYRAFRFRHGALVYG